MPHISLLLAWTAVFTWAAIPAPTQSVVAVIASSRAGEKVLVKFDPVPKGEIEVHTTIIDPSGVRSTLPLRLGFVDPNSRLISGPVLPTESRGYLVVVELRDHATGAKIRTTATWVT